MKIEGEEIQVVPDYIMSDPALFELWKRQPTGLLSFWVGLTAWFTRYPEKMETEVRNGTLCVVAHAEDAPRLMGTQRRMKRSLETLLSAYQRRMTGTGIGLSIAFGEGEREPVQPFKPDPKRNGAEELRFLRWILDMAMGVCEWRTHAVLVSPGMLYINVDKEHGVPRDVLLAASHVVDAGAAIRGLHVRVYATPLNKSEKKG
jgi:hypothetical protein